MIKVENLSKKYGNVVVFKDLSLNIPSGSIVRIKGDNGSGKSVLLNLLVGYAIPEQGSISIDDKTLKKDLEFMPNAGVFINAPEFIPHLSGMENLEYLASFRNTIDRERIKYLAESLNFAEEINKKYKTYSLGMKQKMRIIQAIMEDNDYYILDEPFDSLDKKSKASVRELLGKLIDKHKTILYVSHSDEFDDMNSMVISIFDYNDVKIENKG